MPGPPAGFTAVASCPTPCGGGGGVGAATVPGPPAGFTAVAPWSTPLGGGGGGDVLDAAIFYRDAEGEDGGGEGGVGGLEGGEHFGGGGGLLKIEN